MIVVVELLFADYTRDVLDDVGFILFMIVAVVIAIGWGVYGPCWVLNPPSCFWIFLFCAFILVFRRFFVFLFKFVFLVELE